MDKKRKCGRADFTILRHNCIDDAATEPFLSGSHSASTLLTVLFNDNHPAILVLEAGDAFSGQDPTSADQCPHILVIAAGRLAKAKVAGLPVQDADQDIFVLGRCKLNCAAISLKVNRSVSARMTERGNRPGKAVDHRQSSFVSTRCTV
jgi:hypothetical protein